MQVIPPKGLWRRAYHVDFRTQAARDFIGLAQQQHLSRTRPSPER